jgi:uncharacterized membrane protein
MVFRKELILGSFHLNFHKFLLRGGLILIVFILAACSGATTMQVEPKSAPIPTEIATATLVVDEVMPTETVVELPQPTATTQSTATDIPSADNFVSFSNDVFPIVQFRCLNCHGEEKIEEGLDMTSYAGIMNGSVNGAVVNPGDAENSLFVELVASQKMPKRGAKLTPSQVQLFRDWVNQGALEN